ILDSLEERIDVTVFYQSGERLELNDLLNQYALESSKFHFELYDLDRNPGMAKKYGIGNYGETVVAYNGKRTKVSYPVEDKIIHAILKLTRKEKKVICFLKGHGENDVSNYNLRKGYSKLREALESEDYDVRELLLTKKEGIPGGVSVIVICGPKKDFLKEELEALHRFVQEGGKVLFMIDPFYDFPNLSAFLSVRYDVVLGNDVIVDQSNRTLGGDEFTVMIPLFLKHPIIQDFRTPVLFPLARSVEAKGNSRGGVYAQTLAQSDPKSFALSGKKALTGGKVSIEEGRRGPISVAAIVAVESKETGRGKEESFQEQIVILGDSDFVSNLYIDHLGNKDLFLNTVNWLGEEDSLISSRLKRPEHSYRFLKYQETKRLFWLLVILQPALPLIVGLVIYLRRKRKG
ncbi:MAG: hypothetical protein EHM36_13520, partial [Deltaproteobacteria bacterium]